MSKHRQLREKEGEERGKERGGKAKEGWRGVARNCYLIGVVIQPYVAILR